MPQNCLHKNPLLHSGTSQAGRVLQALQPDYAPLDERTTADLILFAEAYARQLNYYNVANEKDGNWQAFMQMDLTVVLALLARMPVVQYLEMLRKQLSLLEDTADQDADSLRRRLQLVFDLTASWLYAIETYGRSLPEDWPFRSRLEDTILSSLAYERYKLLQWYELAVTESLLLPETPKASIPLRFDLFTLPHLQKMHWRSCWQHIPDPDIPFNPAVYGATPIARIRSMALNNLFVGVIDSIFQQSAAISREAAQDIERSLQQYPRHSPHYALLLTFTQLADHARREMNSITGRHLTLYYRDILKMRQREAVGDQAHIVLALQKNVTQHLISAGTAWQAGKDAAGNTIWYTAQRDTIINKASVAALHNLLAIQRQQGDLRFQQLYAAPIANSTDGQGAPPEGEDSSWVTFGQPNAAALPQIGFAIASHLLYMQDGQRTILLRFEASQDLPANPMLFAANSRPVVTFSGAKGWEQATISRFEQDSRNRRQFVLEVTIPADTGPIVPYAQSIHAAHLSTALPVCRILFSASSNANVLQLWSTISLQQVVLSITVTGFSKLTLQNSLGLIDAAKPFHPFSATPYAGSALLMGSKEIFSKDNAQVSLDFEWDKIPQPEGIISHMSFYNNGLPNTATIYSNRHESFFQYTNYVPQVTISTLSGGQWSGDSAASNLFSSRQLFGDQLVDHLDDCGDIDDLRDRGLFTYYPEARFTESAEPIISFSIGAPISPDFSPEAPYTLDSRRGFIRLTLNRDLGHKDFVQRLTYQASKQLSPPSDPYTPLAKSLKVNYSASQTLDFTRSGRSVKWQFFSIHPFGSREENRRVAVDATFRLAPAFVDEGTLYIGFADALPDTSISLLIQVNEGSANPLRRQQPTLWQYLATGNQWKDYAQGQVTDETNGLLQSGVIQAALPRDIAIAPTLMGSKLSWIKVSIRQQSDAVCRMLDIRAQGIRVMWNNAGRTETQFTQPTPAGSITKLVKPDTSIKSTEQPFDSFGGRMAELPHQFQQRVSERLRHKQRGVTIWDYERLVLEAFPGIYKVKCLNHTRVRLNAAGNEMGDNEMAPGSVVIVPLPDLSAMKNRNPLQPLTPLDTLSKIEAYLTKKISGQVQLQVVNPRFEEVVIRCRVRFFGNDPAFYHNQLLEDLKVFMCPWAYEPDRDVEFGGSINKSTIINFMEERPYVDYLSHVTLHLRVGNRTLPQDREEISATTSRSVLVIAPAQLHAITYHTPPC